MKNKELKVCGLCFRCDHRALHLETKGQWQPRCECGMTNTSVCSCYMFKPTRPIITGVAPGYENRPRFGPAMICARERGIEVVPSEDVELHVNIIDKKKAYLYWVPKKKEIKRAKRKRI